MNQMTLFIDKLAKELFFIIFCNLSFAFFSHNHFLDLLLMSYQPNFETMDGHERHTMWDRKSIIKWIFDCEKAIKEAEERRGGFAIRTPSPKALPAVKPKVSSPKELPLFHIAIDTSIKTSSSSTKHVEDHASRGQCQRRVSVRDVSFFQRRSYYPLCENVRIPKKVNLGDIIGNVLHDDPAPSMSSTSTYQTAFEEID